MNKSISYTPLTAKQLISGKVNYANLDLTLAIAELDLLLVVTNQKKQTKLAINTPKAFPDKLLSSLEDRGFHATQVKDKKQFLVVIHWGELPKIEQVYITKGKGKTKRKHKKK